MPGLVIRLRHAGMAMKPQLDALAGVMPLKRFEAMVQMDVMAIVEPLAQPTRHLVNAFDHRLVVRGLAEIPEIQQDRVQSVPVQPDGVVAGAIENQAIGFGADRTRQQIPEPMVVEGDAVQFEIPQQFFLLRRHAWWWRLESAARRHS